MKKWFIWTSFLGALLLFFFTGVEVLFKKQTQSFWLKYFGKFCFLCLLLFIIPVIILSVFVEPIVPKESLMEDILGAVFLIYLYFAGVFVTNKLYYLKANHR